MARPEKVRKVCGIPCECCFGPLDSVENCENVVVLSMDEYETIRLIDHEGLMQGQCADKMQVSRATVQSIYSEARRKMARMLVEGRPLCIAGGNYRLCKGSDAGCPENTCCCHR